jgi:hypothetical protein
MDKFKMYYNILETYILINMSILLVADLIYKEPIKYTVSVPITRTSNSLYYRYSLIGKMLEDAITWTFMIEKEFNGLG